MFYPSLILILAFAFVAGCDSADIKRSYFRMVGFRGFKMPSASMDPTLRIGDHFVTRVRPYKNEKPRRGDIVVFPYPEDRSKDFVKRLVAFGGEKLEIRNKQVFIDGKPIEEPYKQHTDSRVYQRICQCARQCWPNNHPGRFSLRYG